MRKDRNKNEAQGQANEENYQVQFYPRRTDPEEFQQRKVDKNMGQKSHSQHQTNKQNK